MDINKIKTYYFLFSELKEACDNNIEPWLLIFIDRQFTIMIIWLKVCSDYDPNVNEPYRTDSYANLLDILSRCVEYSFVKISLASIQMLFNNYSINIK